MATDQERHEVARKLRESAGNGEVLRDVFLEEILAGDTGLWFAEDIEIDTLLYRLADLIEPGEPPYNLYTLYEAVFHRFPRCWGCIEDDEVDELVDTLLNICNTPGHDVIQRPQPSVDRNQLPSDCGSRKELKALSAFSVVQSEKDISGTTVRQYDFFDGSKKACSVQTFDWWDGKNVAGLEVSEEYKGRGLSYSLLDYAVNELNVVNLAVEKSNSIAMHVYEKYGFVRVDEDESYVYMSVERGVES